MINYRPTIPPIAEPVSLTLAKQHARVESGFTTDDDLFGVYISAAREYCERYTRRAFLNQTFVLALDHFPFWNPNHGTLPIRGRHDWPLYSTFVDAQAIRLPRPRALSITSITYLDLSGELQTLDPSVYYLDTTSEPARIVPAQGQQWPYTEQYLPGSVQVTWVAASYTHTVTDTALSVTGSDGVYTATLSQASTLYSIQSVVDGSNNPVSGYTVANGILTFTAAPVGNVVTVNYTATNVPQRIVLAILLLVSYWYNNREAALDTLLQNIPAGVNELLAPEVFEYFEYA